MSGLNYWERLKAFNLSSIQRRVERYRIIYSWKSLNGLVPSLGLKWNNREVCGRNGRVLEVPKGSGASLGLKTLRRNTIQYEGARLLNAIPCELRNFTREILHFKSLLDNYLTGVSDEPETDTLKANILDFEGNSTNLIYYWCLKSDCNSNWTPNLPLVRDGQSFKILTCCNTEGMHS